MRKAAERAKEKLLHGIQVEAGAIVTPEADHALAAHVRTALASLPQAVSHYTAEVTEQLLEDNNDITSAQVRLSSGLWVACASDYATGRTF